MHLHLTFEDTTAFLTFDRRDSEANILDSATLEELAARLDELASEPHVTGLLIRSAKPVSFISGADPGELRTASGEQLDHLVTRGQVIFNRLADLPFPSVAAIHGACVGGGCELALACDWRVASDSALTEIGLPQTRLGILPAWGGTTRLPDLLGLQDALPVILSGKLRAAADARNMGLVDEVVPEERLNDHALTYLARGKRHLTHNPIVHNQAVAALIRVQAQKEWLKNKHGHDAGREAALEVAVASIGRNRAQSQQAEREAIARLATLPETANLTRLFFLRERALKLGGNASEPRAIRRAAVIGAGLMGSGIAYRLSARGIETILRDDSHEALALGLEAISGFYAEAEKRQALSKIQAARGLDRIHPACGNIPLENRDLIMEATLGELSARKRIFADLCTRCRLDAILATCTSALPVGELAASVTNPARLVGLHFIQPVHSAELVEVIRTAATSEETLAAAMAFVRGIGKLPVVVRDSPGFLVNRILMPCLVKAASLFEQGGDPEEIDKAMLDFGMPMGPLRWLDEIGLDDALDIARILASAFPGRMEVPDVLGKLLEAGHIGRKGGSGFYVHDQTPPAVNAEAISCQTGTERAPENTQSLLADFIREEARLCLAEGLAESGDDIDLAMILGGGYPPFRGGPLADGE